jgi:hypothetical protein
VIVRARLSACRNASPIPRPGAGLLKWPASPHRTQPAPEASRKNPSQRNDPYAWRILFRDTTGESEVQAAHNDVIADSRAAITPLLLAQPGVDQLTGTDSDALDMAWEVMRAVLQGLALWWYEHQHVPRAQVVTTAMNALWIGFERLQQGESWQPQPGPRDTNSPSRATPSRAASRKPR